MHCYSDQFCLTCGKITKFMFYEAQGIMTCLSCKKKRKEREENYEDFSLEDKIEHLRRRVEVLEKGSKYA